MGEGVSVRLSDTDLSLLLFRLRGCGEVVCQASDILRLAEELRDWRTLLPLLEEVFGDVRPGGGDPFMEVKAALDHGVVLSVAFDPSVHGVDEEYGLEAGDETYVLSDALERLLGRK